MKNTQRITRLSLLIALSVIGRLLFQPIPNVQPMTAIIIIIIQYYGIREGMIIALGSVLLSNILLGMGPWTIGQIISYFIIIGLTYLLMKNIHFATRGIYLLYGTCVSFIMGLLYGLIISVWTVYLFQIQSFLSYYLRGISFDLLHGIGNGIFYFILAPIFFRLFNRMKNS